MREMTRLRAATKQNSRRLRREMTDAEKLLWRHLRMEQFDGYKFRRQHPLGDFIVDFVCLDALLVLEVDGGQHTERTDSDANRTRWIETKGFCVMRFWNNEVLSNIEGVKLAIWNYLKGVEALHAAGGDSKFLPPPLPSPCKGEGVKT
ncbi:MAG: endonuclease domain-containing protein [Gallionella sp.]|nr:endonuclease domain-containing protein [Gallionella sp.]